MIHHYQHILIQFLVREEKQGSKYSILMDGIADLRFAFALPLNSERLQKLTEYG
jgi:hypothetical protein